ncbi:hypothetical protein AXI64_gp041 [Vibrio phage qdvp001]|uniref:hypothetical protein n=1 Tax=Vibrio phage qdvp001 TaxID=1003177 RepID=UPI00071F0C8B|nr:hypothetical protein AXI64_gp041 [Vibrio phage qdvp001]ALM62033.1 hypothetical protein qdvp001_041 [Vibrio phage qdvp001]
MLWKILGKPFLSKEERELGEILRKHQKDTGWKIVVHERPFPLKNTMEWVKGDKDEE